MIHGVAASKGVGVGAAYLIHEPEIPTDHMTRRSRHGAYADSAAGEMDRFYRGREVAVAYYRAIVEVVKTRADGDEAEIFEGHIEILSDDELRDAVSHAVHHTDVSAERAVLNFAEKTAKEFEELDSEYLRQRGNDIRDIGNRLVEAMYYGSIADPGQIPEQSVVVAIELTPSATALLDASRVAAIVTERGGRTSHAAILARSLSIPCVTGADNVMRRARPGAWIVVDGGAGTVVFDADEATCERARRQQDSERAQRKKQERWARETPARLADGRPIHLSANVNGAAEARRAVEVGARGSGLFRSEFFFTRCPDFPNRDQQAAEYRAVCTLLAPYPVVVRLLDCGADKPLPYVDRPPEDNPFLGERGIRFLAAHPDRLRDQVAAIVRVASEGYAIRLMIPMVIDRAEIESVRALVDDELAPGAAAPQVGIMVETPASVLRIAALIEAVDFISIGTNDLTQYLLAVDRGNAGVGRLYDEFHPSVITAIDSVASACRASGVHVAVCGDMASHAASALALLALGVDELSATGSAISDLKRLFSRVRSDDLRKLARRLRNAGSAAEARRAADDLTRSTEGV